MFNIIFDEIDFDKVTSFCGQWSEGVRVDYKVEPANIAKVVSSFANTAGNEKGVGNVFHYLLGRSRDQGVDSISNCRALFSLQFS
jgi:hypothetical protein